MLWKINLQLTKLISIIWQGSEAKFMHLGELQQKLHMAMN